jgi:hypothetical protein
MGRGASIAISADSIFEQNPAERANSEKRSPHHSFQRELLPESGVGLTEIPSPGATFCFTLPRQLSPVS